METPFLKLVVLVSRIPKSHCKPTERQWRQWQSQRQQLFGNFRCRTMHARSALRRACFPQFCPSRRRVMETPFPKFQTQGTRPPRRGTLHYITVSYNLGISLGLTIHFVSFGFNARCWSDLDRCKLPCFPLLCVRLLRPSNRIHRRFRRHSRQLGNEVEGWCIPF